MRDHYRETHIACNINILADLDTALYVIVGTVSIVRVNNCGKALIPFYVSIRSKNNYARPCNLFCLCACVRACFIPF